MKADVEHFGPYPRILSMAGIFGYGSLVHFWRPAFAKHLNRYHRAGFAVRAFVQHCFYNGLYLRQFQMALQFNKVMAKAGLYDFDFTIVQSSTSALRLNFGLKIHAFAKSRTVARAIPARKKPVFSRYKSSKIFGNPNSSADL